MVHSKYIGILADCRPECQSGQIQASWGRGWAEAARKSQKVAAKVAGWKSQRKSPKVAKVGESRKVASQSRYRQSRW